MYQARLTIEMSSEDKEIEFFKCGEIFTTKEGIFRYDCVLCGLKFENSYLIQHILKFHFPEHSEIINEEKTSSNCLDNLTNYHPLSSINYEKLNLEKSAQTSKYDKDLKDDYLLLKKYNIRKKVKISLEKCNLLDNISRKVKSSITKLKPKYRTIYKCTLCSKNFNNNIQLKQHYKKIHLINNNFTNKFNNYINSDKSPSDLHTSSDKKIVLPLHSNESKFQVDFKEYINNEKSNSVLKKSKQNRAVLISKDNCNINETLDKKETKIRDSEKHVCEICGKESTTKYNLNSHIKLKHSSGERKKYSCEHCKKTFLREQSLQNHIKIIHLKEKPFVCVIDKCERTFVDEKSLKNHQAFHINERKFTCTKCGKKYLHKSKLDAHFKIYHVLGRTHQCKECNKSFYDPYTLRNHMICHTGEKPFACDECPARFPRENALQWHKKVHSGVKDHICKICGQAYHLFTGLYAHMKTHGIKYNKKIEKGLIPIEKLLPTKIMSDNEIIS